MSFDLEFEKPLAELDKKLQSLRGKRPDKARNDEIVALEHELQQRMADIYAHLTPWQHVQIARHKSRPYTSDYIRFLFSDFVELRGDRRFADDKAIMGGLASLNGQTVMILGHQKGRDTRERQERNFGMAHPEGYRKTQRLMAHAERFGFPVLTFIDTAGAYLSLAAEERGIAQAIAESIYQMSTLRTPIVATIIGEGGSGGALGLAVADRIIMLEHSIYTVASPEAAASILWKDASQAPQAAEAMKIIASDLLNFGLIDRIVPEPHGGAHRDHRATAEALKISIVQELASLSHLTTDALVTQRYNRLRAVGTPLQVPVV